MPASNDSTVEIDVTPEVLAPDGRPFGFKHRWKDEDKLKRALLGLRFVATFFSQFGLIFAGCNRIVFPEEFDKHHEYRYLLAISILSSLYTLEQFLLQTHQLRTGEKWLQPRIRAWIDFLGDQLLAYLLISSASSAFPITDRIDWKDHERRDSNTFAFNTRVTITSSFLAFIFLAISALISGYRLIV